MNLSPDRRLSLSTKFILLTGLLIIITAAVIGLFVIRNEMKHTYQNLLNHGRSVATIIAQNSQYGIYTGDKTALRQIVDSIDRDPDIAYLFIMDEKHRVLMHKPVFGYLLGIPEKLSYRNSSQTGQILSQEFLNTEDGQKYIDVLAPVESQPRNDPTGYLLDAPDSRPKIIGHIQLGLTEAGLRERIRKFLFATLLFTFLIVSSGVAITVFITRRIVHPIKELNRATRDIALGRLDTHVTIKTRDEIADLAEAFNNMLDRLKTSRDEVEKRTFELMLTNDKISQEISVRKQTEAQLMSTKARLENLLVASTAVIYSCLPSAFYRMTFISENVKLLLGYEPQEITGDKDFWPHHIHTEDIEYVLKEWGFFMAREHHNYEYRIMDRYGNYRWIHDELRLLYNSEDNPAEIVGTLIDITERKKIEERLAHTAFHDALTLLPNRALFFDRIGIMFARANRNKDYAFAVIFIDLDHFKKINDSLGHVIGDQLLVGVAQRLKKQVRASNTIARLGGDEFAILIDDFKGESDVVTFVEKLHKEMAAPFSLNGHEVYVTVSIGIAVHNTGYEKAEDLVRDADTAMYKAKTGRSTHAIFDDSMHIHANEILHTETLLRHAMERKEFVLHYQPIVSLETGNVEGFEALLRLPSPDKGLLLPEDFITIAEESGLIVPIGAWVLEEACREMAVLQTQIRPKGDLSVSVNISCKQFTPDLITHIAHVLQINRLDPSWLRLEITEGTIMGDVHLAGRILSGLKDLNVSAHIDNFGTGYSSLSYLHSFPIDALKIDRSFIATFGDDKDATEIVRSIVLLAHNLKMRVIAEGVETREQLETIKTLRCDSFQGYLCSAPMDFEALVRFLQEDPHFS